MIRLWQEAGAGWQGGSRRHQCVANPLNGVSKLSADNIWSHTLVAANMWSQLGKTVVAYKASGVVVVFKRRWKLRYPCVHEQSSMPTFERTFVYEYFHGS